jgi:hypothetical protein
MIMAHVKDQQSSASVMPWNGSSREAPDATVMCDGKLTTSQEAYADVTRCDSCKYYSWWGIGD